MCILFFCQSEIWQEGGYRLILANNRDEYWDRPTKDADFWEAYPACFGGVDAMPGREGGTWLGMNKDGKIGVLLNILSKQSPNKKGRGHLVTNFLTGSQSPEKYAKNVHKERKLYNDFSLILFDIGQQEESLSIKPVYVSNSENYHSTVSMRTLPANSFFGISNSPLEYPFKKVEKGRETFGQIICQFPNVKSKEHLTDNLFQLMKDDISRLPDPVLEAAMYQQGCSPQRTAQQAAVSVHAPAHRYGTRTTTLLLVDWEGNVDYIERNFDFPPSTAANSSEPYTFQSALSLSDPPGPSSGSPSPAVQPAVRTASHAFRLTSDPSRDRLSQSL